MELTSWIKDNYIEVFGAITGIIYVILEIRQNIWLWPLGIITSAVYIWVFFTSKFYADMTLQGYYLVISVLGWYWWTRGRKGRTGEGEKGRRGEEESGGEDVAELRVSRLKLRTGIAVTIVFLVLFGAMWTVLSKLTDSPVPGWDSFITSLSVAATWMLARKIYEHWYLWIAVNIVSAFIFFARGLYPTMILYIVYALMSFIGIIEWRKSFISKFEVGNPAPKNE